jgi:hypothetical protein
VAEKRTKILPTWRIAAPKQLEILRAFGALAGKESKSISNAQVASSVKLKAETIALGNAFYVSIDLLTKSDKDNGFVPSDDLMSYARAAQWDVATAPRKLGPKLSKSWFGEALIPKLRFKPLMVDEAISALAEAAESGPNTKPQLDTLLFFLEQAGLIVRENGTVKIGTNEELDRRDDNVDEQPETKTTARDQPPLNGGAGIQLNFSITVPANELHEWMPDRITAFMSGLAQVLAAKNDKLPLPGTPKGSEDKAT